MPAFYPEGDDPRIGDAPNRSLQKINSLLKSIDTKTGSTTITGPVTVSNEVEVTNDEGNPLPVSGTVTAAQSTASNLKAQSQLLDSTGTLVDYATIGTAGSPSADVVSVQGVSGGVGIPTIPDAPAISNGIQYQLDNNGPITRPQDVADGIQSYLDNYGNTIPVDGSGVTQPISAASLPLPDGASTAAKQPAFGIAGTPSSDVITVQGASSGTALNTKETQPIGDYVINVGAVGSISLSGSAVSTAGFDSGGTADYIAVTLEGAGASGAFTIDLSTDNTTWVSGTNFGVYYDIQANSATDAYSHKTVQGTLFGGTRSAYWGRFIVSCTQQTPNISGNTTYRYFRLTSPASYGGWRYKFSSYKSITNSIGLSNPGGLARVTGRVDVGYVSNLPTLTATVTQSTATNLRTQAETYQGGTAVGSANPLQVTLANTAANPTAIKVDGSAVTQPVSIASAISQKVQGWDIPIHDYRGLGYTSGNLTSVTYKTGGSSGTTVATLTLGYDGSGNLTSVTKT